MKQIFSAALIVLLSTAVWYYTFNSDYLSQRPFEYVVTSKLETASKHRSQLYVIGKLTKPVTTSHKDYGFVSGESISILVGPVSYVTMEVGKTYVTTTTPMEFKQRGDLNVIYFGGLVLSTSIGLVMLFVLINLIIKEYKSRTKEKNYLNYMQEEVVNTLSSISLPVHSVDPEIHTLVTGQAWVKIPEHELRFFDGTNIISQGKVI